MTLLVPKKAISLRWEGALQARLRRAPVEVFLRSRDLKMSAGGASLLTDNLVRATVYVVEQSVHVTAGPLGEYQQVLVCEMACSICEELASLVCEPNCGRIAALVSAAQLLSQGIGRKAAAFRAAAAAREYWKKRQTRSVLPVMDIIGVQASSAVRTNRADELLLTVRMIDECLSEGRQLLPAEDLERREPTAFNSAVEGRPTLFVIRRKDPSSGSRQL